MISRKLIAALVGLSVATGTLGAASAQTTGAPMTRQSAPVTAGEPNAATPATVKAHRHTKMHKATHRKHVAHRATKGTKVAKVLSKPASTKLAAKSTAKRVHVSRNTKHTTKHV